MSSSPPRARRGRPQISAEATQFWTNELDVTRFHGRPQSPQLRRMLPKGSAMSSSSPTQAGTTASSCPFVHGQSRSPLTRRAHRHSEADQPRRQSTPAPVAAAPSAAVGKLGACVAAAAACAALAVYTTTSRLQQAALSSSPPASTLVREMCLLAAAMACIAAVTAWAVYYMLAPGRSSKPAAKRRSDKQGSPPSTRTARSSSNSSSGGGVQRRRQVSMCGIDAINEEGHAARVGGELSFHLRTPMAIDMLDDSGIDSGTREVGWRLSSVTQGLRL